MGACMFVRVGREERKKKLINKYWLPETVLILRSSSVSAMTQVDQQLIWRAHRNPTN